MSAANHEEPGFELPQPVVESNPSAVEPVEATPIHSEQASKQVELPGATPIAPPPTSSATTDDIPAVAATSTPTPIAKPTTQINTPSMADDADLIEKEWVEKAKAIVDHTRDDPHQQNKKLNEFKADYMKKRYSKEIKLTDE